MNPALQKFMDKILTDHPELNLYRRGSNLYRITDNVCIVIHLSVMHGTTFSILPLSGPIFHDDLTSATIHDPARKFSLETFCHTEAFNPFQLGQIITSYDYIPPSSNVPPYAVDLWVNKELWRFYSILYPILCNVKDAPSAFNALLGLRFAQGALWRLRPIQSEYLLHMGYPDRADWFVRGLATEGMYYFALECRYYDFLIEYIRHRLSLSHSIPRTPTSMNHDQTRPLAERLNEFRTNMQALHNHAEPERLPDSDGSFDSKNRQLIYALLSDKVFPELESSIVTSSSYRDFPPPPRNPELLAERLTHFEAHDDAYVQALIDENRPANVELINSILPKRLHIQ